MFDLASTRIDPITLNLSLMPEVDTIAFAAPVITEESSLLDPTPEHLTLNDTEVTWTMIKSNVGETI